jgi:hypothetical protein
MFRASRVPYSALLLKVMVALLFAGLISSAIAAVAWDVIGFVP